MLMDAATESLAQKLLASAVIDVAPDDVLAEMSRHAVDVELVSCSCGVEVSDPLEHLRQVAFEALGIAPSRHERRQIRPTARVDWFEGATNRIDQLLDFGRDPAYIAEALGIPLSVARRRRRERQRLERPFQSANGPAIAPDRQLEIAMAALNNQSNSKEQAA
jgi:hypothetical protein